MSEGIMLLTSPPLDHTNENDERATQVRHKRPMRREAKREKQRTDI